MAHQRALSANHVHGSPFFGLANGLMRTSSGTNLGSAIFETVRDIANAALNVRGFLALLYSRPPVERADNEAESTASLGPARKGGGGGSRGGGRRSRGGGKGYKDIALERLTASTHGVSKLPLTSGLIESLDASRRAGLATI